MKAPRKKGTAGVRFFRFHFLRRLWLLPLIAAWVFLCLYSQLGVENLPPLKIALGLAKLFALYLPIPCIVLSIFIFTNPTELEFCQCYGFSPVRLGLTQLFPPVFFQMLCTGLGAFLAPGDAFTLIPNLRWLLFLESTVNLFAVVSAVFLARVLIRNLFGTLGAALILYYGITMSSFVKGSYAYYFVGKALFVALDQDLPLETFYVNRGIFTCFAVILSAVSILILRGSRYTEKDI